MKFVIGGVLSILFVYKFGGDGVFGFSGGFVGIDGLVIVGGGIGVGCFFVVVSGGWG